MKKKIQYYYGQALSSHEDLRTSVCCCEDSMPEYIKKIRSKVHPDVLKRFYGCGAPFPFELKGKTVLDLGCGSGADVFVLSGLVGQEGKVIGVDMTKEQIEFANSYIQYHKDVFGYDESNVSFKLCDIENLEELAIPAGSVDVVVSNCVINLAEDKQKVFNGVLKILADGGECYFSDIFTDRRMSQDIATDPLLYSECIGGAMYFEDFRRILYKCGIFDFRTVSNTDKEINDHKIQELLGNVNIESATVRFFKLELDDKCENYGQVAIYKGGMPFSEQAFILDNHHEFIKGLPMPICINTAQMLSKTRFAKYFEVIGNEEVHYGLFPCCSKFDVSNKKKNCC